MLLVPENTKTENSSLTYSTVYKYSESFSELKSIWSFVAQ